VDIAARIEIAVYRHPARPANLYQGLEDLVDRLFVKNAAIPELVNVKLE